MTTSSRRSTLRSEARRRSLTVVGSDAGSFAGAEAVSAFRSWASVVGDLRHPGFT
jgi:hypothetical protein